MRPEGRTPSSKNCRRASATRCAGVLVKSWRGASAVPSLSNMS
jgi:hypothetical protein